MVIFACMRHAVGGPQKWCLIDAHSAKSSPVQAAVDINRFTKRLYTARWWSASWSCVWRGFRILCSCWLLQLVNGGLSWVGVLNLRLHKFDGFFFYFCTLTAREILTYCFVTKWTYLVQVWMTICSGLK